MKFRFVHALVIGFAAAFAWSACAPELGAAVCEAGEMRPHIDGCNECFCNFDHWSSTARACAFELRFSEDLVACHSSRVADLDPDAPGIQPECYVEHEAPGEAKLFVPPCEGADPNWALPDGEGSCWVARGDPSKFSPDCVNADDPDAPVFEVQLLTADDQLPEGVFHAVCQAWPSSEDVPQCAAQAY